MLKLDIQFFGGRGAGGVSRDRGASVRDGDIISTRDMLTERMGSKAALVDETLGVFRDAEDSYGTQINEIQIATMKSSAGVLGYYDSSDNIAINESYFDSKKMNAAYDDSVKQGYHPKRGKKSGLEAVVAHEVGHKLTEQVAKKMGKRGFVDLDSTATQIVNEARKQTRHRGVVQLASKISKYATSSNAEAVAEAYADVYCNGKKARKESKAIMNVVNSYLK